jgi:hypothetical protein
LKIYKSYVNSTLYIPYSGEKPFLAFDHRVFSQNFRKLMKTPSFSQRFRFSSISLVFWFVIFFVIPVKAFSQVPLEYQVKAVYIYKLLKFTNWPEINTPLEKKILTIGILGDTPLIEGLSELKAKNSDFNPKIIRLDSIEELPAIDVLFISESENPDQKKIMAALSGRPVVTFGEEENFLQNGGMINFSLQQGKVRFDINLREFNVSGIQLSSRALRAANRVIK